MDFYTYTHSTSSDAPTIADAEIENENKWEPGTLATPPADIPELRYLDEQATAEVIITTNDGIESVLPVLMWRDTELRRAQLERIADDLEFRRFTRIGGTIVRSADVRRVEFL